MCLEEKQVQFTCDCASDRKTDTNRWMLWPKVNGKIAHLGFIFVLYVCKEGREVCKRGVQKKIEGQNYKQCRSILINVNIKHKSRTTKCCVWLFMNSSDGSCIGSSLLSCDGHKANICTSDRNCWFGKGELWSHSSKSTRKYSSERHLQIIRQANILVEMQR